VVVVLQRRQDNGDRRSNPCLSAVSHSIVILSGVTETHPDDVLTNTEDREREGRGDQFLLMKR
jgi:hypothetical protein